MKKLIFNPNSKCPYCNAPMQLITDITEYIDYQILYYYQCPNCDTKIFIRTTLEDAQTTLSSIIW